jgi:phage replication O-like protein O
MTNPQTEKGYTRIANEILEVLARTPLKGSEHALVMAVLRKTYGFQKKEDKISISQLQDMMGLSRRAVIYNLQNLEAKGILVVARSMDGDKNDVNLIRFNKNYDTWVVQRIAPQVERNRGSAKKRYSAKNGQKVVQRMVTDVQFFAPTKETIQKKLTKEIAEASSAPFSLKEEIQKLEDSPRRDLNIIALYFSERKPDLQSKAQLSVAIKRHLRAAKDLTPFTDNQIIKAFDRSKEQTKDWTIETAVKNATK